MPIEAGLCFARSTSLMLIREAVKEIGVTRFELATSASRTQRSSQAELHPVVNAPYYAIRAGFQASALMASLRCPAAHPCAPTPRRHAARHPPRRRDGGERWGSIRKVARSNRKMGTHDGVAAIGPG